MKIEKLQILRDELRDEFSPDGVEGIIYYFFEEKWNQLDSLTPVPKAIAVRLERSKSETVAYRPTNSHTAWFACADIEGGISLTFQTSPQQRTLETYRRRLLNVLKRASNSYKVSHNPLTQLLSKDAFRAKLSSTLSSISNQSPLSEEVQDSGKANILAVFALDIDHFKQVNDTHGHLYGDQVLKVFALRLELAAEKIAQTTNGLIEIVLGHPSGEEFLISIYGSSTRDQILELANIFREEIGELALPTESEWARLCEQENLKSISTPPLYERNVTASVGVTIRGTTAMGSAYQNSVEVILDEADTALYRAKAAGRYQVIAFDDILNSCGRVLEHDTTARIIAIDIGKNVGVTIGQEFRVFTPGYTGKKKFSISDGRTKRTIGNYPRIELTTITVFEVQSELSFAYISDTADRTTTIDEGSVLEAIPTGSISHLLIGASRYFPTATDHLKAGDSSAAQEYIRVNANTESKPFAVVFRFASEKEYLKRYGSAAFNSALARLYRETTGTFHSAAATGILDTSSVCVVGRGTSYNEKAISTFADRLRDELPELRLTVGIFCHADVEDPPKGDNSKLDSVHAIEFARYAASDHAAESNSRIIHFGFATARRILNSLRESKAFKQGIADYEKLRSLGVRCAALQNLGGLLNSSIGNYALASDLYEDAVKCDPKDLIYKTNFGIMTYYIMQIDRGLQVLNTLSVSELKEAKERHPLGYMTYALLLARAKLNDLPTFNKERFSLMAQDVQKMPDYQASVDFGVIEAALKLS